MTDSTLPVHNSLGTYHAPLERFVPLRREGRVTQVVGHMVESANPGCTVGSMCLIHNPQSGVSIPAEVVGLRNKRVLVMPLQHAHNLGPKCRVIPEDRPAMVPIGHGLLGRVIDPLMRPMDGKGELLVNSEIPLYPEAINPLSRKRIKRPLDVGIRAINACLMCGRGQRIGIMAGSGVGKSVLLGMMARYTDADITVISLIGERGKEVREFIEDNLGEGGLKRSVVVVATSDQPPLLRMRGAFVATAIAEYFRNEGQDVLLAMDSLTRFAMAQREIGLAAGEPPTTKGYPPSVYNLLPRLLERAGTHEGTGSITGFYTVLVEGDDLNDPIGDAIRAIVDGHIVLSRDLAAKGIYPAVDILNSSSRVMVDVATEQHLKLAQIYRRTLATYREAEDLINIGAYVQGSNPEIDYALSKNTQMQDYALQDMQEHTSLTECEARLLHIFGDRMTGTT